MRSCEAERIGVVLALHALGAASGELVEIVEVAGELGHAPQEPGQAFGAAKFRIVLAAVVDEGQPHHLAGALPDQYLQAVFGGGDVAFEPGAVFGIVFEVCDVDRVHHPAQHFVEPGAHELA